MVIGSCARALRRLQFRTGRYSVALNPAQQAPKGLSKAKEFNGPHEEVLRRIGSEEGSYLRLIYFCITRL